MCVCGWGLHGIVARRSYARVFGFSVQLNTLDVTDITCTSQCILIGERSKLFSIYVN